MWLASLSTVAALAVLNEAQAIPLRRSFLHLSAEQAQEVGESHLQQLLDEACAEQARRICNSTPTSAFCNGATYARRDVGHSSQKSRQWRCFHEAELDFEQTGRRCVDDCGLLTMCKGIVNGLSSNHTTYHSQSLKIISDNKDKYCVPKEEPVLTSLQGVLDYECQKLADKQCYEQGVDFWCDIKTYARKDKGSQSQGNQVSWRCYGETTLHKDVVRETCVDDCGNMTECSNNLEDFSTLHMTTEKEILAALDENKTRFCFGKGENADQEASQPQAPPTTEEPSASGTSEVSQDSDVSQEAKIASEVPASPVSQGPQGSQGSEEAGAESPAESQGSEEAGAESPAESQGSEEAGAEYPAGSQGSEEAGAESPATETPEAGESHLQQLLDQACAEQASQVCQRTPTSAFCHGATYARRDVGNSSQPQKHWRCFHEDQLDFSLTGRKCVDDCGLLTMCKGIVNGLSANHTTYHSQSLKIISDNKDKYCVPKEEPVMTSLQGVLDYKCQQLADKQCYEDAVDDWCEKKVSARKDKGSNLQPLAQWRCYDQSNLHKDVVRETCVDDCGNMTECSYNIEQFSQMHFTPEKEILATIDENKTRFCVEKEENADQEASQPEEPEEENADQEASQPEEPPTSEEPPASLSPQEPQDSEEPSASPSPQEPQDSDVPQAPEVSPEVPASPESQEPQGSQGNEDAAVESPASPTEGRVGNLQKMLDARCMASFARKCSDNEDYCVLGVARMNGGWKCYARNQLGKSGASDGCVDDCGGVASCEGSLPDEGNSLIVEGGDLQGFLEELKSGTCQAVKIQAS